MDNEIIVPKDDIGRLTFFLEKSKSIDKRVASLFDAEEKLNSCIRDIEYHSSKKHIEDINSYYIKYRIKKCIAWIFAKLCGNFIILYSILYHMLYHIITKISFGLIGKDIFGANFSFFSFITSVIISILIPLFQLNRWVNLAWDKFDESTSKETPCLNFLLNVVIFIAIVFFSTIIVGFDSQRIYIYSLSLYIEAMIVFIPILFIVFIIYFAKTNSVLNKKVKNVIDTQIVESNKRLKILEAERQNLTELYHKAKEEYTSTKTQLKPLFLQYLPPEFCFHTKNIEILINALKYGKVDNLKEAYQYFEEHNFRKEMLDKQQSLQFEVYRAQAESESAKEVAREAIKSAEDARRSAESAEREARDAINTARRAEWNNYR